MPQLIHPSYYTEEEKKIILDKIIYQSENCKINFDNYLDNFIKTYGTPVEEEFLNINAKNYYINNNPNKAVNPINWRYNTHQILWGNENNDNLVTFILSHPNYNKNIKGLRALNKLHPNWNHQNKDGNNALHLLAKMGQISDLKKILHDFPLDTNQKNKNKDYFTYLLLSPESFSLDLPFHKDKTMFYREIGYTSTVMDLFIAHSEHFSNISLNKIEVLQNNVQLIKEKLWNNMEQNPTYHHEQSIIAFEAIFKSIDLFLNYLHLDATLDTKTNQITTIHKKLKI